MRNCGYETKGISTVSGAITRLVERGKIVLGDQ